MSMADLFIDAAETIFEAFGDIIRDGIIVRQSEGTTFNETTGTYDKLPPVETPVKLAPTDPSKNFIDKNFDKTETFASYIILGKPLIELAFKPEIGDMIKFNGGEENPIIEIEEDTGKVGAFYQIYVAVS